jgi:hypothetical protein
MNTLIIIYDTQLTSQNPSVSICSSCHCFLSNVVMTAQVFNVQVLG